MPSTARPKKPKRPNTKRTGERSEAAFLTSPRPRLRRRQALGRLRTLRLLLDNGPRLWRVQTKCTECLRADAYETRATYTRQIPRRLHPRDIDFLAAHVVPLDVWYIIPVEVCTPAPMLRFYPHRKAKKMRLEKYREAWRHLKPNSPQADDTTPITLYAAAQENASYSENGGGLAHNSPSI